MRALFCYVTLAAVIHTCIAIVKVEVLPGPPPPPPHESHGPHDSHGPHGPHGPEYGPHGPHGPEGPDHGPEHGPHGHGGQGAHGEWFNETLHNEGQIHVKSSSAKVQGEHPHKIHPITYDHGSLLAVENLNPIIIGKFKTKRGIDDDVSRKPFEIFIN